MGKAAAESGHAKPGSPARGCPGHQRDYREVRTPASKTRHALAETASTAPAWFAVSRTTTPRAALPTSTHCPPLAVL
jgi:hypothetical protein